MWEAGADRPPAFRLYRLFARRDEAFLGVQCTIMYTPLLLCVLNLLTIASPLMAGDSTASVDTSGSGWSYQRMDLDIFIRPEKSELMLRGKALLRLEASASMGPTLCVNARCPLMEFVKVEANRKAQVQLNTMFPPAPFVRMADLRFDQPVPSGTQVEVSFECRSIGVSYQFDVDRQYTFGSWVEGWYPVPRPWLEKGQGLTLQLASVPGTTRFHLPEGWHAIGTGTLRPQGQGPGTVETWETSAARPRSFAAAPYQVARHTQGGRPVSIYRLSGSAEQTTKEAEAVGKILTALEQRYGPFPYEEYGVAELPPKQDRFYASSEAGFVMALSGAFGFEDGNVALFGHEMAHGWWGNKVGSRGPGGILCDEALAQYGVVIAIEAMEGRDAATEFLRFSRKGYVSNQCARGYFQAWREGKDKPLAQITGGPEGHLLADAKGVWVYHMLRERVGDAAFFSTLRGLLQDRAGSALSLQDIRHAFVAAAPGANLEAFFRQWLDGAGAPVFAATWSDVDQAGQKLVSVSLRQMQPGAPFGLTLDVAVDSENGTRTHPVAVTAGQTTVLLPTDGKTKAVRLDPQHKLLTWCEDYGPAPVAIAAK